MLDWNTKQRSISRHKNKDCDVIIKALNDEAKSTCIRFVNRSFNKITKSNYIIFAVEGTKLYFKEADSYQGYKLSMNNEKSSTAFFKLLPKTLKVGEFETGEYKLEYDKELQLYFVDVKNKLGQLKWSFKRNNF